MCLEKRRKVSTMISHKETILFGIVPNFLTHTPTPGKKREIWDTKSDFYREFTGNFRPKGVKYAIKTVIYKSLGSLDPTHPHLGQLYQIKQFFYGFPNLKSYIDSKLYDYSEL